MGWQDWRRHFERSAQRPLPPVTPPQLDAAKHAALLASLKKFQLGEAGEGRVAQEVDRVMLAGIDGDYRAAFKRFIAEEGRHARILKGMVEALGGEILRKQWAEQIFVHIRRCFGFRFKLTVLQAAEVIGIGFYGVLAASLPPCELNDALRQICGDEEHHLRFHRDFFATQRGSLTGELLRWLWWPLGTFAAAAMLFDHRRSLRALEIPLPVTARRLWREIVRAQPDGRAAALSSAA
jgi:hypothetical protein